MSSEPGAPTEAAGAPAPSDGPDPRRRTFAPVVLLGLAGAALAAAGATRVWFTAEGAHGGVPLDPSPGGTDLTVVTGTLTGADVNPLVSALALVALASWGAVLVLRGRARRGVAVLGGLASAAALVALLTALVGRENAALPSGPAAEAMSAWPWVTGIALLATTVAFLGAVRDAPGWPTMSSRYDTPSGSGAAAATQPAADPAEEDPRSVWRALDDGRDPTD